MQHICAAIIVGATRSASTLTMTEMKNIALSIAVMLSISQRMDHPSCHTVIIIATITSHANSHALSIQMQCVLFVVTIMRTNVPSVPGAALFVIVDILIVLAIALSQSTSGTYMLTWKMVPVVGVFPDIKDHAIVERCRVLDQKLESRKICSLQLQRHEVKNVPLLKSLLKRLNQRHHRVII